MGTDAERDIFEQEVLFPRGTDVPAGLALATAANDRMIAFLRGHPGVDDGAVFAANLAFEELATNVARHAVPGSSVDIRLWSRVEVNGGGLVLVMRDDGPAYDPLSRPAREDAFSPEDAQFGGMGLELLRNMFPDSVYRRDGDCNEVRLRYTPQEE